MREIKFRAWDKNNGVFLKSFYINPDLTDIISFQYPLGFVNKVYSNKDDIKIMEFSGCYDKNGKPIYESDIVRFFDDMDNTYYIFDEIAVINKILTHWFEYQEIKKSYKAKNNNEGILNLVKLFNSKCDKWPLGCQTKPLKKLEVIGNIYKNPDLLK